ncbi:glycosyl hydrolase [Rhodopirellula sp. MGV]|nr:glycosyl hydrolase [Rhodopirellula sp. MGV]PNY36020.1 glycosyl hydrolase [Rhodopirellula baltica]
MKMFFRLALCCVALSSVLCQSKLSAASPETAPSDVTIAERRIRQTVDKAAIDSAGQIVVVYFTPKGTEPAKDYVQRLRRIVDETSTFYETELEHHGFANRKMRVLRDSEGLVRIIDVVGVNEFYDKPDGTKIRNEIVPVLREQGINPDQSVLLMFCNLMDYDPVKSSITHHSPYYGGGTHLSGNAWQCDSQILDPLRLVDSTPLLDGQYGRITIGRHNSIFIGGVIHELGHALSLPHCRERVDQSGRGTALMGSGNRTFGEERRGEGKGSFLTQAHAFRLAAHPVFNSKVTDSLFDRVKAEFQNIVVSTGDSPSMTIRARVHSAVPVHAVVAYFDATGGSDYDATTATAVPDADGNFVMESGPLRVNSGAALRLVACHVNGATTTKTMSYRVSKDGQVDLSTIQLETSLASVIEALSKNDLDAATKQLELAAANDKDLRSIGERLLDRFRNVTSVGDFESDSVPDATAVLFLNQLKPVSETVGWMRPTYNRLPGRAGGLLSIDGDYFANGIYAHAPATHVYSLNERWKRLSGQCGIQGANYGQVEFIIQGDGKTLFQSGKVGSGDGKSFDVDVTEVKRLTLQVTNGGDGNGGDWGIWIEPTLRR